MYGDNWSEETTPSRRVRVGEGQLGDDGRSKPVAAPVHVWFLGFVVVLLALAVCGLWALYLLRGRLVSGGPTPTAIVWTPTPAPTATATPLPPPTEVSELFPTVSPGIAVGDYVRVTGTGGYGLNLRSGPGEDYARMDVALEGEILLVVDGPTVTGDSEWWKIRDQEDEEREWWAIANFLEPVDHP